MMTWLCAVVCVQQVVLPFVEKYFHAHRAYFIAPPNSPQSSSGMASIKEKEMTARCVAQGQVVLLWPGLPIGLPFKVSLKLSAHGSF